MSPRILIGGTNSRKTGYDDKTSRAAYINIMISFSFSKYGKCAVSMDVVFVSTIL